MEGTSRDTETGTDGNERDQDEQTQRWIQSCMGTGAGTEGNGRENTDHKPSTKDGWELGERQRDPERQGHRSKERQRHQRDTPKCSASGGPG